MTKYEVLKAMELATVAYNESQPLPKNAEQLFFSASNGVQYFTQKEGGTLRIIFRGSNSKEDWRHNFAFRKKEIPYGNADSKIRVHGGFLSAYKCDEVRDTILSLARGSLRVLISGHSYGAALAVLCALDLQYNFPEKDIEAYLFGCPRVGNRAFSISYNRRVIKTIRVENGNDIVTRVPFSFMGFCHVGVRFHIGARRLPLIMSASNHYQMAYYEGLVNRLLV